MLWLCCCLFWCLIGLVFGIWVVGLGVGDLDICCLSPLLRIVVFGVLVFGLFDFLFGFACGWFDFLIVVVLCLCGCFVFVGLVLVLVMGV